MGVGKWVESTVKDKGIKQRPILMMAERARRASARQVPRVCVVVLSAHARASVSTPLHDSSVTHSHTLFLHCAGLLAVVDA